MCFYDFDQIWTSQQIFVKVFNVRFYDFIHTYRQTDRRMDMTKVRGAFSQKLSTPKMG